MSRKEKAATLLIGGLVVGTLAQNLVTHEAAVLGLTALELGVIGLAVPTVARRIF